MPRSKNLLISLTLIISQWISVMSHDASSFLSRTSCTIYISMVNAKKIFNYPVLIFTDKIVLAYLNLTFFLTLINWIDVMKSKILVSHLHSSPNNLQEGFVHTDIRTWTLSWFLYKIIFLSIVHFFYDNIHTNKLITQPFNSWIRLPSLC